LHILEIKSVLQLCLKQNLHLFRLRETHTVYTSNYNK
jgi:hypothetical protein